MLAAIAEINMAVRWAVQNTAAGEIIKIYCEFGLTNILNYFILNSMMKAVAY